MNVKKRYRNIICSIIFNIFRIIGFLRPPLFRYTFQYISNIARAGYWSSKLKKIGNYVQIDSGVIIRYHPENVEIDGYSYIDKNVELEIYNGSLKIGKYVHISSGVHIQCGDDVKIGDFVGIASNAKIYSSTNTYKTPHGIEKNILLSMSASAPKELQYTEKGPVVIEDYAFIGLNSVILPGVRIGKGAIIGAGAVVTKNIPAFAIAVGAPAKPIKQRPIPQ